MTLATITDVKNFWNARPCNIRHSPAPVGSVDWIVETEQRKRKVEPHIAGFAQFDKWFNSRVLEIGCGIGIDTVAFARTGAKVTAIDVSEESLHLARKRANLANVDIKFYEANAEQFILPVNRGHFDLVYAFGSIHHSPNPDAILDNARYFIKDGGTLKLMVYNKYSWKSFWILLKYGHGKFWKFKELVARYSEAQTGCPITYTFSKRELRAMLERNGFHVRKMYVDHVFKFDIEAYKRFEYKTVWYFRWIPDSWFRAFERVAGWHLLCEATV
jgi:2-polyprenyl-3-methyl-5-hydroxy-6-metoxy-1,4-benzoquinol methylase